MAFAADSAGGSHAGLSGLTPARRDQALARWQVLRAHLEDGCPLVRILRRVVAEFGAETAPDEVDAERFAEWFGSQWAGGNEVARGCTRRWRRYSQRPRTLRPRHRTISHVIPGRNDECSEYWSPAAPGYSIRSRRLGVLAAGLDGRCLRMSEQLFRFSILRAPEPATGLTPIVVQGTQERIDDRLASVAVGAVSWLKSEKDLPTSTVADLRAALNADPARWDEPMLAGLAALGKQQFAGQLRNAASESDDGRAP